MDTEVAKELIEYIQTNLQGVFRSSSIKDKGVELGVSLRTVNSFLGRLRDENLILQCKSGLYVTSEAAEKDKDLALIRAGMYVQPGVISLDSAFTKTPLSQQQNGSVHIVSPQGRVGMIDTPIGHIHIHSVSKRLQEDLRAAIGQITYFDEGFERHTPEAAIVLSSYLSKSCGLKTDYTPYTRVQGDMSEQKILKGAEAIGVRPEYIQETLEAVIEGYNPTFDDSYSPSI